MYSKCIFLAITLAFFAMTIAETAASDDSTKEKHEKFLFNSSDQQNLTVFTFDVKTINVKFSDENFTVFYSINPKLHSIMLPAKQDVNATFQDYTLILDNNNSLSLTFLRDGDSYNLSMIELNHGNNSLYRVEKPDLKLTKNTFKRETQGYKCNSLKLTFNSDVDTVNSTVEIEFIDLSFIAFQNSIHTKKPSFLECRQAPGSTIIPLAVGGSLLVFMGIALVVYIFMRNRSG